MLYRFDEFEIRIGNAVVHDQLSGTAEIMGKGEYWEVGTIYLDTVTNRKVGRTILHNSDSAPPMEQAIRCQIIAQLNERSDSIENALADYYPARKRFQLGVGHLQSELV